ncbi:MAG: ribonuclease III [Planctomycetaceae bacterium]|nr:ribonuclease III [Planctomycetaceae bacterium]
MELEEFLTNCQKKLGVDFRNTELLRHALTHSSGAVHPNESNERMEFLGDSVLGYIICDHLYRTYPDIQEGAMTKIKSSVVSRTTCHRLAEEIGLRECLILGRGMSRLGKIPGSVLANTMEAFIAALYLDGGLEKARKFILRIFRGEIEKMLVDNDADNFKSLLQDYVHRKLGKVPEYKIIETTGPDHLRSFHVGVKIGGESFPSAWGATKKIAEQRAAENALAVMKGDPPKYVH